MTNNTSFLSSTLHSAPYIDNNWVIIIFIISIALIIASFFYYQRAWSIRALTFTVFILSILNLSLLQEERTPINDVAIIMVDQSASQVFGERTIRTETALTHVKRQLDHISGLDVRVITAPHHHETERTDLFTALDQALADVPQMRRAGVIIISDGQIHDVPQNTVLHTSYGPVHILLTGEKSERDRRITITNAPAYGVVGENVTVKYRVNDTKNIGQSHANITLTMHDGSQKSFYVQTNKEQEITVPIAHPSQNTFSLSVESVENEITRVNNQQAILINGVRNRLKVLLISGVPHTGERTWRDLLTSDAGIDLVHFTILREPQKLDYTPQREMSLIAFPFKELFEIKLYDFDLIIFDRYRVNNILPPRYFHNIAQYVREGGAFLAATGPDFATRRSIAHTPLGAILPARPTGTVMDKPYQPNLTNIGKKHPVTRNIIWRDDNQNDKESWGKWMRYIDLNTPYSGDTLLQTPDERPLLILDRMEQGRVAQLSSDHIWLWARGYDGGGPHAELLRRIVHWLMKEPELDERALDVNVFKKTITIKKQNYNAQEDSIIAMTTPTGEHTTITLTPDKNGMLTHTLSNVKHGIYAFEDIEGARKFAIVGTIDPPEIRDVITTDKQISPMVHASKGATIWLDETNKPRIKMVDKNARTFGGSDWVGLRTNNDYTVSSLTDKALLPHWVYFLLLISSLLALWWHEGKRR